MIKILIADDEPLARARIKRLLATNELCTVVGEASNGEQVIELCKQLQPDLVMLDINMPKQSGLEVAAELKQFSIPPAVMFLTAHPEYALTAFELAVDGYLVKPVSEQALTKAMAQLSKLNRTQVLTPENNYICYQLAGVLRRVNIDDVICCIAEQKYTRVVFFEGEALVEQSLKQLEQTYPLRLLRIHRNTLVNKQQIVSLNSPSSGGHTVTMKQFKEPLSVSRRELKNVKAVMGK
ncbi:MULTISPECIES: LytTR family DNA-binding domain-containing protein [unclassified Pseudoalteromonas]|uniref:LytR/AlgR family response regulator transcription factor n=1 Tax=Pseudoalteromonas TaxID=53246 RepID=UPI001E401B39|nr:MULTISPECIES: LytTR family DNA-binding domain-containing protein [unclassified Pseudoalteromonas]|tara:strand:+ start:143 stop:853 length:711 start_codon:yes stop_codon:yes gene_type:complete